MPPVKVEVPAVLAATVMGPEKVEVAPFPNMLVVAVIPTKMVEVAVKEVEEAILNVWRASHLFALFKLREATMSPVVGEMVKVPSVLATEATPVLAHVPLTAKHPSERLMPLAKVEEAEVENTSKAERRSPALKVEVAVLRTFKCPACIPPENVEVDPKMFR